MEKLLYLSHSAPQIFLLTAICVLVYFCAWSYVAIQRERADLADIAWGLGFCLVSWVSFSFSEFSVKALVLNLLITVSSLRLSIHIYLRNRNRQEDFRYQKLKKRWGKNIALRMFLEVFLLQAVILYVVSLPIIWINTHSQDLTFTALWFTIPFWLAGFCIETIGDYQLYSFFKNSSNKGKLLTTGIWGYVRHPNYLGEIIQWWSIWSFTLFYPLIVSPLLITFIIIKVSGVAPVEEKMKNHPDYAQYAKSTPSLFPFPFINGGLYFLAWLMIIFYGSRGSFLIPLIIFVLNYVIQMSLLYKWDRKKFLISFPLCIYALFLGLVQETFFIHVSMLTYSNGGVFPPFWLVSLYPLFSLTLNCSLLYLNRNLLVSFFAGGIGAILSYLSGQRFGAIFLESVLFYPITFISWGAVLLILIVLNRKLIALGDRFTNSQWLQEALTVFFDGNCPVCSREMEGLKKRNQTGQIVYVSLHSEEELKKITQEITYPQAMEKIHAIRANGEVLKGIDVLSELYARTDLSLVAIWLQAPVFRQFFQACYAIWAKFRRYNRDI